MSLGFLRGQVLHSYKGGRALGLIVVLLLVSLLLVSSSLADEGEVVTDTDVDCTPGKRATLCGQVVLEGGHPSTPGWTLEVTVIIRADCRHSAREYHPKINASGKFCIPNVPVGTFNISVKAFNTLSACQSNVKIKTGTNNVDFGTLLAGDANDDNRVNKRDQAILLAAYGKCRDHHRHYDPRADFNYDGCVNKADADLLSHNLGQVGCELCH